MMEDETNFELLQIAFNSLKERVVLNKFKVISQNCYKLKTMRKVFCGLQQYDLRKKILRSKAAELRKIQEAKYFWHWLKLFQGENEKTQA